MSIFELQQFTSYVAGLNSRGKKVVFEALLVFGSLISAFVIAEIALHMLHPESTKTNSMPLVQEGGTYFYPPHVIQTNDNENGESIRFETSSLGLRETELTDDESPRILVLGDSFVEAANTPLESSFTRLLQKDFGHPPARFVNGGIGGYGNYDSYFLLERLYPKMKPKLIVLMIYLGNDLRDNFSAELGNAPLTPKRQSVKAWVHALARHSQIALLVAGALHSLNDDWDYFRFEVESFRKTPSEKIIQAQKNTAQILRKFKNFSEQNHVPILLFGIPSKAQTYRQVTALPQ